MRRLSIVLTAAVAAMSFAVGPALADHPTVCVEALNYDLGCVRW